MTLPERAAALAVQLANSRIITPVLTDDAAHLDVTLDVAAILAALEEAQREAIIETAHRSSRFSMRSDRSLHPDIAWDDMNEAVRVAAHSTAQSIALDILAMLDPPDSKRPGTPEDAGPDAA